MVATSPVENQPSASNASRARLRVAEIGRRDPGPAHEQHARRAPVVGQALALLAHDLELDAPDRMPLLLLDLVALLDRQPRARRIERADRADRAHLGHAPAVQHLDPVLQLEGLDHRKRRRSATDHHPLQRGQPPAGLLQVVEQTEPDGRHAGREGHPLALELLVQAGAIQPWPRHHHPRADQRAGVGQAPGIDVEHRHDRQHRLPGAEPDRIRQRDRQRMQHGRAVVVEGTLGIAGRAGGVAEAAGRGLVEHRPVVLGGVCRDQALVAPDLDAGLRQAGRRQVGIVGEDEDALEAPELRREALEQRQEHRVGEQIAVLGVIDDVGDLVREQARVDRVADRADARDAVVELEMAMVVPGKGRDPVAHADLELRLERVGQLPDPGAQLRIAGPVRRLVGGAGDHLGLAVIVGRVVEDRRDPERQVHHQAAHDRLRRRSRALRAGPAAPLQRRVLTRAARRPVRPLRAGRCPARTGTPWPN